MKTSNSVRALVTGASGAIGKAISLGLARAGFEIILVCRNKARGSQFTSEIKNSIPEARVSLELCDLSSPKSIFEMAERWPGKLGILVNNAAQCPRAREVTSEGYERQFATNILAYAAMSEAFENSLVEGSRIINVASYWAGGLDLTDLQFQKRRYNNDSAYRQSKQENRMLPSAY
ncbi:SDR family NAD(P)-dependent oxidoreductase, partial [bacterium]|nr:SDR family NAD(P)-dependent oxidoreductase [bacterium]